MPITATQPDFSKENLQQIYQDGNSMTDMAKLLSCSIHKVVYWMDKYNIKRRNLSQAIYLKSNPNGDPFKIKTNLNANEMFLFGLGLGIYWGEGEKTTKNHIRVANSNPEVIKAFRKFLLNICRLRPYKLLYQIICFNDSNVTNVREFWSNKLGVNQDKFGKIVQIPSRGKGTYRSKSSNGVCILTVASIKLKPWIMQELSKLQALPG